MAEGRDRAVWNHTSSLLANLVNCWLVKGKSFQPADFNPYCAAERAKSMVLNKSTVAALMLAMGGKPAKVEGK